MKPYEPIPEAPKSPGEAKNGMTAEGLSQSGHRVLCLCLGIEPDWENLDSQASWIMETTTAIHDFEQADESSENGPVRMDIEAMAIRLHDAIYPGKGEFKELSQRQQFSFKAVIKHWANCIPTKPGDVNVPELERQMPSWVDRWIAKANGELEAKHIPERTKPKPLPETAKQNGFAVSTASQQHLSSRDTPLPASPQDLDATGTAQANSGAANGFREIVEMKIREHARTIAETGSIDGPVRKIASLHQLLKVITPECDEALWEVFKDVFSPQG